MHDDGREQQLDVRRNDVAALLEQGPGARGRLEREAAAHGRADRNGLELPRRADERDDPAPEQVVDVDGLGGDAQLVDVCDVEHGLEQVDRMPGALLLDDPQLVVEAGIAERRAQEEAVELCLREREGALELDRVLGREEEEGLRHRTSRAVDGDLTLCHRFEQGRLRLRHGSVDLVDEDDVREDRAGPELEVALTLVVDREPGDVGRLQVRRALDPRRLDTVDRLRDRARQDRLRSAGHVLQQDVAAAEERREHELDPVALAVDDGLDVVEEPLRDLDGTCERVVVCSSKRLCLHVPPSVSGRNVAIRYIQETPAWPSGLLRRDYGQHVRPRG